MSTLEQLENFRTRWRRWLGGMTRSDMPTWTELINVNWSVWARATLEENGQECQHPGPFTDRETIKNYFLRAINCATMHQLMKLDNIYAYETFIRESKDR